MHVALGLNRSHFGVGPRAQAGVNREHQDTGTPSLPKHEVGIGLILTASLSEASELCCCSWDDAGEHRSWLIPCIFCFAHVNILHPSSWCVKPAEMLFPFRMVSLHPSCQRCLKRQQTLLDGCDQSCSLETPPRVPVVGVLVLPVFPVQLPGICMQDFFWKIVAVCS